jgi:hypothetical protein
MSDGQIFALLLIIVLHRIEIYSINKQLDELREKK